MPILTNHEVAELRKMAQFACRLVDLCDEVVRESDFMLCQESKIEEIAAEIGLSLPLEKPNDQT